MKKLNFLVLILISVLAFGSCVKDSESEGIIQAGTEPIEFGLEANSETRAKAITTALLPQNSQFGILAYKTTGGASYFSDTKATQTDAAGLVVSMTTTRYWPASTSDKLNFYAYYPHNDQAKGTVASSYSSSSMKVTYTATENYADHDDLMVASNAAGLHKANVSLVFNHALTRLTFEAKKDATFGDDVVSIASISIENIKRSGRELTVTSNASPDADKPTLSWSAVSAGATEKYTAAFTATPLNSTTYTKIENSAVDNDSFMVVPTTKAEFGSTAVLKVVTSQGKTYEKDLATIHTTYAAAGWEAGEWVNYQLLLKPDEIIVKGVTVNAWPATAEDVPVEF